MSVTGALPPPPRGVLTGGVAVVWWLAASLVAGLALYAYVLLVEVHLLSARLSSGAARFEPLRLDAARARDIRRRGDDFFRALRAGAAPTLSLGNDEINEWLALATDADAYRDRLRVRVRETTLAVWLSLPMDRLGYPGRHLNAEIDLDLALDEEGLHLAVEHARVGGAPLPPRLMQALRWAVTATRHLDLPPRRRALRGVRRIRVEDRRLVIEAG